MAEEKELNSVNKSVLCKKLKDIDQEALEFWKEALSQLRKLSGDFWNGIMFFLGLNGILISAMALIFVSETPPKNVLLIIKLASIGIVLSLAALMIITRQRKYYVEMLRIKTLIEDDLGFYEIELSGIDLSFPWKVPKEKLDSFKQDPGHWLKCQMWRKWSVAHVLFCVCLLIVIVHVSILLYAIFDP